MFLQQTFLVEANLATTTVTWVPESKTLVVAGDLNETTDFSKITPMLSDEIIVDFSAVRNVNSIGVKVWMAFAHTHDRLIRFVGCTTQVVGCITMIPAFVGRRGVIDSFEVCYYCGKCGSEDSRFLKIGVDVQRGQASYDEFRKRPCPSCGEAAEIDCDLDLHFSFLRKKAERLS